MANRLAMDKTQGIMQLFAAGMSERQIARTLDIDRKSVDRELRLQGAKGANPTKAPTGLDFLGSDESKGAKAPTGCETTNSATVDPSGLVCCDCRDGERKVVAGKIPKPTYQLGNIYGVDFLYTIIRYALRTSWEKLTSWHGPKECGNYMNPSWPLYFIDPHRTFEFGAEVGINFPGGGIAFSMTTEYHSAEAVFLENASEKPQQDPCYIHVADLYVEMVETGFHYTHTAGDPMRGAVDDFVPMDFDLIPTLGTPPKWYTKNWRIVVYATCCSGNKK